MPTIQLVLESAIQLFPQLDTTRLEVEVLLCHVLRVKRSYLYTWPDCLLTTHQIKQFQALCQRRRQGEPIAYLIGHKEFWSLELQVTPATLIPRSETELLVEQALARLPIDSDVQVVDLGTGSGAIALAIAQERPHCQVLATDNAPEVLAIAQQNAQRLRLHQIQFRVSDWWQALNQVTATVVVSNPPYVAITDPHLTQGDVRYEPRQALIAGKDGLAALRLLITQSWVHLELSGWLLLEHGYNQAAAVQKLLARQGYQMITTYPDLAGQPRVTVGQKL
ncbi:MAG: peptide chain release factor N(5)-glutamine methyltransferase [Thioploca sp.]|nr:peptide chain release factor N(5)-glutamine methyltransferase [Thioploca sp.]